MGNKENNEQGKTPMKQTDAARIQRHADRSGTNQGFKGRAQAAGAKNDAADKDGGGQGRGQGR